MLSCEGIGKNIEQAIENALFELKASREDVDIKIISQGGFLKKARVVVTISPDAVEKYEKKNALKAELLKEEKQEEVKEEVSEPVKEEVKEEKKEEVEGKTADEEEDEEEVERPSKNVDPKELLENIVKSLGLTAEITSTEDEKYVHYMLEGENLNTLIGYHGDALYALSYYVSNVCRMPNHKKVVLDINNYRSKRAETLTKLAKSVADKVAKSGRYYKFDPMDASERKVIHTALQADGRVSTMSKGEEPNRYLMVFPVDTDLRS